ncbi:MAG: hypothetical protein OXF64_01185 [bacterium]|nr:hypothetical protein [bacterium]
MLRQDPPRTQGFSTEWFALSAYLDGERVLAHSYIDYERAEFSHIYQSLLQGWLRLIVEYVTDASWSRGLESNLLLRIPSTDVWASLDRLAHTSAQHLHEAVDKSQDLAYAAAQDVLRKVQVEANDLSARWIQDLLTLIASHEGAEGVETLTRTAYNKIWRHRYEAWFDLSPELRLALSAEGMRPHYSGPDRTGDFDVVETEEAFTMVFDPCGTGGIMRRGDPTTGLPVFITDRGEGTNAEPRPWSWGRTGVSWYCGHCPMLLEVFPAEDFGEPVRPVLFDPAAHKPRRGVIPRAPVRKLGQNVGPKPR